MLLAIDVGNTNITVGLFQDQQLIGHGRISTDGPRTTDEYTITLRGLLDNLRQGTRYPSGTRYKLVPGTEEGTWYPLEEIDGIVLSSVVPRATVALRQALKALLRPKPYVLGENIQAPVINRYRIPSQVGQDRLVDAAAAFSLYGGPVVVVDFGTAVTVDLVSKRREYLGGVIVPGVEISLEALMNKAALLPRIELKPPHELLGRDTVSSMQSGIFFGYSALCDGIVRRLKATYAPKGKVVATGGHADWIAPFCRTIQVVNPHLTLQGLELTYRKKKGLDICQDSL